MKTRQLFNFFILGLLFFGFSACNNEDISEITIIKLTASDVQLLIDEVFNFEVKGNNSEVITDEAIIKADGVPIGDTTFSSPIAGEFEVQAFYEDFESNIVTINTVFPIGFIQNVLVEDYTGTWCVNCPRVSYAIEQAKMQSDKVVSVGIHYFDEMEMDGVNVLTDEFGIVNYPTGRINRINDWDNPDNNIEAVTDLTGYGASLGLSIDSSIQTTSVNATMEVGFEEDITTPLKIVVYLTENGLIYDQSNSTDYYNGENPIIDFEHNDVLRAIYTHHLGDVIPAGETTADNVYTVSFQETIPPSVANNNELHLVAFITNANTNEVLNVREAKVGVEQDLQEL